jgi:uncharacterized membrane protein
VPPAYGPPNMGGPGGPTGNSWSPTEAIGFGWNALLKNFAGIGLPIGVAMLILIGPSYGGLFAAMSLAQELVDPEFLGFAILGAEGLIGIYMLLAGSFLGAGVVNIALKSARGEMTTFGDVFAGGKYFGSFFVGGLCFFFAYALGAMLCLIPGLYVLFALYFWPFTLLDQNLGGVEALKKTWAMSEGHRLNIFVFYLLGILVSIAGELACGVGVLVGSLPIISLGLAYIYLRIKGETPRLPGT